MLNIVYKLLLSVFLLSSSGYAAEYSLDSSLYGDAVLLSDIFIKRHSGTNFATDPLSDDHIKALVQSARWAPSSYNDQPWNFIFCDRYSTPESFLKVLDSIYGQDWTENVPLFIITVARTKFLYNQKKNDWAEYDTGAAALSMSLLAADIGLVSHQIGGFDRDQIKQDFHLPEGHSPLSIIAIGYEADEEESEQTRERRPVEENFFLGDWGQPLTTGIK